MLLLALQISLAHFQFFPFVSPPHPLAFYFVFPRVLYISFLVFEDLPPNCVHLALIFGSRQLHSHTAYEPIKYYNSIAARQLQSYVHVVVALISLVSQ